MSYDWAVRQYNALKKKVFFNVLFKLRYVKGVGKYIKYTSSVDATCKQ